MFLNRIGICFSVCVFALFGVPAVAEPDNPVRFNRGVAVKLKKQINDRPFIANRLSRDKQVREFLKEDPKKQAANPHQPPSPAPKQPFDAPLPHPFDSSANEPSVVLSPTKPETNSHESSVTTKVPQTASYGNSNNPSQENNRQLASDSDQGEENSTRGPASLSKKVSYKHSTVVFYKKKCHSNVGCIKVPVLTNLKNVIFEYNQGRYSANSIGGAPFSK